MKCTCMLLHFMQVNIHDDKNILNMPLIKDRKSNNKLFNSKITSLQITNIARYLKARQNTKMQKDMQIR